MGKVRIEQRGSCVSIFVDDEQAKKPIPTPQRLITRKKLSLKQRVIKFWRNYQLHIACLVTLTALIAGSVVMFCKIGNNIAEERIYDYGREKRYAEYTVQAGDDLYGIAKKMSAAMPEYAGVNAYLKDLRDANGMSKYEDRIVTGQTLKIPYFTETASQRKILGTYSVRTIK